jgi:hypothetical protein
MFPAISVSGMTSLGGGDHRFNAFMSYPFIATLTRTQGKHNWKVRRRSPPDSLSMCGKRATPALSVSSAGFTQGPIPTAASSSAGLGFASFLLGAGTTATP